MGTRGRVPLGLLFAVSAALVPLGSASAQTNAGSATFTADYDDDVPAHVRAAVDHAMGIWARRIHSAVPIDVAVRWGGGLPRNVAAATEPGGYARVTPDGPLHAIALANAVAGYDREPSSPDIRLVLGSGIRWYTGTDGATPAWATDMVSMVLHELAHGLGFIGSFRTTDSGLGWGRAVAGELVPVGVDSGLVDTRVGAALTDTGTFPNPSPSLFDAATSAQIVWGGGARDSHGHAPVMYAPGRYEPHSSLLHFDDGAYAWGDPDALMTSLIKRGEVIHHIGPATLGVLRDLGWRVNPEAGGAVEPRPRAVAVPTTVPTPTTTTPTVPPPAVRVLAAAPIAPPAMKQPAPSSADVARTDPVGVLGVVAFVVLSAVIARNRFGAILASDRRASRRMVPGSNRQGWVRARRGSARLPSP